MDEAVKFMQSLANEMALDLWTETSAYVLALPDQANDRPYCAGQEVLNEATAHVIRLADAMGWNNVPRFITKPGTIEPPCFMPPVSEGETRSMAVAEEPSPLKLSIADTSRFAEGRITLCFRNEGNEPVRIPDEINDETSNFFFVTLLRTEQGKMRVLNREIGTMTFQRPLNYRELPPARNTASRFRCSSMKSGWKIGNNVLVNWKRATIISRVRIVPRGLSGRRPNSRCDEKNLPVFRNFGLPVPPCSGMGGYG